MKSFLIRLILLTVIMALIIAVCNFSIPMLQSFQLFTWISLAFFFLLTLITGYMALKGMEKSPHGFVASVSGIVMVKLFLSAGLVIAYVLLAKPDNASFIISFFVLYVVYTVFEIRQMILAQKSQQRAKPDGQQ